MIESLKRELDKPYRNFDLLIQGSAAIHGFANIMKDLIKNGCLQIAGADALEHTPEPAILQEIVQMFGSSSVKSLRDEAMKGIDSRVMYNFVSMLQEDYAVLWKLKLSVSHAITAWSVWKSDAIYKAIQEATRAELLFIAETVDVRIEEQRAMLTELFIVAGKTITRHKVSRPKWSEKACLPTLFLHRNKKLSKTLSACILKILVATMDFWRLS